MGVIMGVMKEQKKLRSVQLPLWMDTAIYDLAQKHKRSVSSEIAFLIEQEIKNQPEYANRQPVPLGEARNG
jgi:hypothetical protein